MCKPLMCKPLMCRPLLAPGLGGFVNPLTLSHDSETGPFGPVFPARATAAAQVLADQ